MRRRTHFEKAALQTNRRPTPARATATHRNVNLAAEEFDAQHVLPDDAHLKRSSILVRAHRVSCSP